MKNTKLDKHKTWVILGGVIALAAGVYVFSKDDPNSANLIEGAPLVEVTLPIEFSPEAERGAVVFSQKCASCHGENAAGQEGVAPPLIHIYYEPNHHGDMAFLVAMARGVQAHHWPFGNMPPVEGITEAEAYDVIAYVREIQRANGIE